MEDEYRTCPACMLARPVASFPERGRRCIDCRRAGVRRHYAANRPYYLAKAKARQRRVNEENRRWLISYLQDHPCVDCGTTDIRVLEFDHPRRSRRSWLSPFWPGVATAWTASRPRWPSVSCDARTATASGPTSNAAGGAHGSKMTAGMARPEGFEPPNLLIRSQTLYPLSYGRTAGNRPTATVQDTGDCSRPRTSC